MYQKRSKYAEPLPYLHDLNMCSWLILFVRLPPRFSFADSLEVCIPPMSLPCPAGPSFQSWPTSATHTEAKFSKAFDGLWLLTDQICSDLTWVQSFTRPFVMPNTGEHSCRYRKNIKQKKLYRVPSRDLTSTTAVSRTCMKMHKVLVRYCFVISILSAYSRLFQLTIYYAVSPCFTMFHPPTKMVLRCN